MPDLNIDVEVEVYCSCGKGLCNQSTSGTGKRKKCILCGEMTKGSTGAAGIKWSTICQRCKDLEDDILLQKLQVINKIYDLVLPQELKGVSDE